jgi:hypothetical protein
MHLALPLHARQAWAHQIHVLPDAGRPVTLF